jgi:Putative DNA-binding domain
VRKAELLKDILALANAWKDAPAYLVIGVREQHGRALDFPGVTEHLPDHTVQQFVNERTNARVRFQVETVPYGEVQLDIVRIAAEQERPVYLLENYGRLKKFAVYVRRGSSTGEADPTEIADMARSDALTSKISTPSIAIELADPRKRLRWGTTAKVVCLELTDPPPTPPLQLEHAPLDYDPFMPSEETLIKYAKADARFAAIGFWAQNTGIVNAVNVHLDVRIAQSPGLTIASGHLRPRVPKSPVDVTPNPRNASIRVEKEQNDYIIRLELGTLQPKAEWWAAGTFILTSDLNREISARARLFADDLPNPIESVLKVEIVVGSRMYTPEDLAAVRGRVYQPGRILPPWIAIE